MPRCFRITLCLILLSASAEAAPAGYTCPVRGYVNCRPIVPKAARKFCTPAYYRWAQVHCRGFFSAW